MFKTDFEISMQKIFPSKLCVCEQSRKEKSLSEVCFVVDREVFRRAERMLHATFYQTTKSNTTNSERRQQRFI